MKILQRAGPNYTDRKQLSVYTLSRLTQEGEIVHGNRVVDIVEERGGRYLTVPCVPTGPDKLLSPSS